MMTRKDFEALAATLRHVPDSETKREIVTRIGIVCSYSNGRFDMGRWQEACNA